jgi:hypothetical protein
MTVMQSPRNGRQVLLLFAAQGAIDPGKQARPAVRQWKVNLDDVQHRSIPPSDPRPHRKRLFGE